MASPDDLSYLQVRCAKQGEALWHQFTVREVFGEEGVSSLRLFHAGGACTWDAWQQARPGLLEALLLTCLWRGCMDCTAAAPTPATSLLPPTLSSSPALPPPHICPHLQSFIADDASKDVPRQYITPSGLLCTTCQLAPCKPGCPGSAASTCLDAAATAVARAEHGDAVVAPAGSSPVDAAARLAVEETALSEGRSSEDSLLLGLPSPTYSVLPRTGGHAVSPLAGCGDAGMAGCSGGSSPAADSPAHKHARLAAWDAPSAGGGSAADTATGAFAWGRPQQQPAAAAAGEPESPRLPSPWASSPRGPTLAAAAPQPPAAGSALAAALRGISKGLADDEDSSSSVPPRQPALPPARPPARWETAAQPAAAQPAPGGGGGGGSALAAALASISKGLAEDGLL